MDVLPEEVYDGSKWKFLQNNLPCGGTRQEVDDDSKWIFLILIF